MNHSLAYSLTRVKSRDASASKNETDTYDKIQLQNVTDTDDRIT